MYEIFDELNLTVVELPVEIEGDVPVYRGFIRELPTLAGEGHSRQAMYRQLAEAYQAYRLTLEEESTEEATTSLLSVEDLLKYYDGETFDGFEMNTEEGE